MTLVNGGLDAMSCAMGGDVAGYTGTATATSATSLTGTSSPFVASAFIGHIVVATTASLMYGVITANTTSVLTVDQWYAPGSPGGAAVGPPSSTTTFVVLPGNAPYWYMALGSTLHTPGASDTTLAGEITTSGGGLIRRIGTYAHTGGGTTYSLAATWTANGSDSLGSPVTIYNIGVFNTLTGATGRMMFETPLSPSTATISAVGDQLTVTETITI